MINIGGPKYWIHRSAMHFATVTAVLSRTGIAQLVQRAPTHHVAETILELSEDVAGSLGFGGCPLAAHAGHSNSRRTQSRTSGRARTETKCPQELVLARVPTIVMDFLNDLLLARC